MGMIPRRNSIKHLVIKALPRGRCVNTPSSLDLKIVIHP